MDTLPVQDLVDYVESQIIERATDLAVTQIAVWTGPLSGVTAWLVNSLGRWFLKMGITWVVKILDLLGFKLNTTVVTTDQASDYRKAVAKVLRLPANAPKEEWERLEREANHSFDQLFNLTK